MIGVADPEASARPSRPAIREHRGQNLGAVAFPLGGIGTGTVSLGGRGELRDWELFNRPGKGRSLPFTFFSLWARPRGGTPIARILERRIAPPYIAARGLPFDRACGLPRLDEARFTGEYPFARIAFEDRTLPVEVELEAYTPFVPLDPEASGLPVAVLTWRVHNPQRVDVDVTVALSQLNPVGYDGVAVLERGCRHPLFGGNLNEYVAEEALRGIRMTGALPPEHAAAGSLAIATSWPAVTVLERWERSGWYDNLQAFWDDFRDDGRFEDRRERSVSPTGQTDVGTLGLVATVPPRGSVSLPFVLTWHFPNLVNYWDEAEPAVLGSRLGNWYATRFGDAWDVARHVLEHAGALERRTRRYHEALFGGTLPDCVLDAVSSQASTLRTATCLRTQDGVFHGFEGCNDDTGSCPMDCTHVWNYEQALAQLFPTLARTMRETDLLVNTKADGEQVFRTLLPVSTGALWKYHPAADGQMGSVIKLYREWQLGAGDDFLRALWPHAKRALEFAWAPRSWDPDRVGVMDGEQHNTYDIEFYGPNSLTGTLYLAALRCAAEMARAVGDEGAAVEYDRVAERGAATLLERTWNGEYFEQRVVVPDERSRRTIAGQDPAFYPGEAEPRYQYGSGCLTDQLLGQWLAHVVGIGHLLPAETVRSAIQAVVRHNWRADLGEHESCQRTYALNDEAGLLLCSWPRGERPAYPFPYADEVWSGCEYQVAAHLIYEGFVDEGLKIVAAVRARHDGVRRNPWNEFECGHHYVRAMSSWSLLLALSGFAYSAPRGRLAFAPAVEADDFRCLFTAGAAWGVVRRERDGKTWRHAVEVIEGSLTLRTLAVGTAAPPGCAPVVSLSGAVLPAPAARDGGGTIELEFAADVVIGAGAALEVALAP